MAYYFNVFPMKTIETFWPFCWENTCPCTENPLNHCAKRRTSAARRCLICLNSSVLTRFCTSLRLSPVYNIRLSMVLRSTTTFGVLLWLYPRLYNVQCMSSRLLKRIIIVSVWRGWKEGSYSLSLMLWGRGRRYDWILEMCPLFMSYTPNI